MATANLKINLLEALEGDVGVEALDGAEQIFLTPYLALACGLLYMMAADGELETQESSQLQSVLGGDKAVLSYALRYVQSVSVEQFFATASELLSVKDKWCILTNVCDALLADGRADRTELALFAQMTAAFGVRDAQFEPYFKILALKNDKSVLGKYTGVREDRQPMTPHFALAIALLYMLTSDGSIGVQEVGQLESVIGEFEGLQNVALKYVRTVKLKQFLDEASALLRPEQKIYILTNVCDSMLSDGEVAHLEDKLFFNMLTAFGFTEKTFARYLQVLETKNLKPFDTSAFKNHVKHDRLTGGEDAEGITFQNALTDIDGVGLAGVTDAANQGIWVDAAHDSEMGQFIARTMDENIQSVSDDFENQNNVVQVGLNATAGLNVQKLGHVDDGADNRQRINGDAQSENLQKIDASDQSGNRQQIESSASVMNRQSIDVATDGVNLQTFDVNASDVNRAVIPPEIRLQNIHEVAEEVHGRLDRFEVEHFRFLQIGRAHKFTDTFELLEDDPADVNRQLINDSYARMGIAVVASADSSESSTDLDVSSASTDAVSVPMAGVDGGVPSEAQSDKPLRSVSDQPMFREHVFWRKMGLWRGRAFVYVQLVVATMGIVFASPIETRLVLGRTTAGPLLVAPILTPEFIEQPKLFESELTSQAGDR
jgi:uncharacterized tellurite resistance protein B-like protein